MTTTRRTLSSLAVLALAAGLMTGCGDKDDPSPSAGSEATASAPEEQSDGGGESAKPDVPKPDPKDYAGMDEHTDEGAEQAFKYFMDLAVWGYQTGDSSEYSRLYVKDSCDACVRTAHEIDETRDSESEWSQVDVEKLDLRTEDNQEEKYDVVVVYNFRLGSHEEPIRGNPKKHVVEPTAFVSAAGMDWDEDRWIVAFMDMKTVDEDG